MIDPIPAGQSLPSLGSRALVDVSDGDTPNIRMPVRMLSIDTPEVTARSEPTAEKIDAEFSQLAKWLKQRKAPISRGFRDYILPKLETGRADHFGSVKANPRARSTKRGSRNACVAPPADVAIFLSEALISRLTATDGSWPMSRRPTARKSAKR